ncbi:MAG: metallophosphoesterase [Paludibacter sp.]|nr:metallophosphoesterase [Bacteroidales bacterium]MCM1069945.1 metallophosphoesterase [Prevotella sp.]MCM1354651.1 metallophosphoesterase [Bacteroides sp.]MCM1443633.1 metallophosphoesterase [Muribaculum sp.]MCM1482508.1 metallophosphoesterase [Paludibacter sp.]
MRHIAYIFYFSISISLILLSFIACNPNYDMLGMFYGQSPRSNERVEASLLYNEQQGECVLSVDSDTYKVYFGTDMHVDSTARNLRRWVTSLRNDPQCRLGIILGDMVNAKGNFPRFMEALYYDNATQQYDLPLFATAGNHDLYFGQWSDYLNYWHSSTYTFLVRTPNASDLYICLDSGDGTFGTKQLQWLRNVLSSPSTAAYRHIIVFTHTHMFKRDASQGHTSNFPMEETYEVTALLQQYGVEWYVSGHDHHREITRFRDVQYMIVDTMQDPVPNPFYMVATIGNQLEYEYIAL